MEFQEHLRLSQSQRPHSKALGIKLRLYRQYSCRQGCVMLVRSLIYQHIKECFEIASSSVVKMARYLVRLTGLNWRWMRYP